MSLFTNVLDRIRRPGAKHLVIGGTFAVALACSIGLGVATKQYLHAAVIRDPDHNSIDYADMNGGAGAADPTEMIKDVRANNPGDLQTIYAHFGLSSDKYDQFASQAREGLIWRDGHVEVDGQTVMTNALTMGRTSLGQPASVRKPINIGGTTYYQSTPNVSFAASRQNLPVMVLFDDQGVAQVVIMNPCGNPVQGTPVTPKATCNALKSAQPDKTMKPNTYDFTTDASFTGTATLSRVVYHFSDDNSTITKTSLTDAVEHTFTKDGHVTVTVFAKVPGGHEIQAAAVNCEKNIAFTQPYFVCTSLVATPLDDQKRSFRFTVHAKMDATTTLKSVDFTLDSTNTTTGVTTKDAQGNVYKDYSFTDSQTHKIVATLTFNTFEGVQSTTCEASVTPSELPKCTVPGHETEAPNSPTCGYCKPGVPFGSEACKEVPPVTPPAQLTNTGPGDVVGLFAGTSALGAVGHRMVTKLRRR